jgi:serine/threonine-protein kinase
MDDSTQPAPSSTGREDQAEPAADLSGRTLGDFRLLRVLGQGGMGQVYLARQVSLNREVAVKILKAELAANQTSLKRFKEEARAAARLNHPNIVQIYWSDEADGLHYMALEYVEGRNLRDFLQKKGPPELPGALSVMRQVAAALQRASELGFVHRDVKPENILLTRKGEAKLADFGLSRCFVPDQQAVNLTQSGVTMGTPLYMSPEQVQGKPLDPRSDIYSFGATCFTMLAGHPPFRGETGFDVAVQHVQAQTPDLHQIRPDLPAELCAIVHKMMAKKPEDRYQSGREVLRDLARVREALSSGQTAAAMAALAAGTSGPQLPSLSLSGPSGEVGPTTALPPVRPARPGRWVALGVVVAFGVSAGAALSWWQDQRDRAAAPTEAEVPPEPEEKPAPLPTEREQLAERAKELLSQIPLHPNQPLVYNGCIELGVTLLEQRHLDDAHRFFEELRKQPRPDVRATPYKAFAQIGLAMELAYRDQAKKSVEEFGRLFTPLAKQPKAKEVLASWYYTALLQNGQLQTAVRQALDRNAKNLKPDMLPAHLEQIRNGRFIERYKPAV